MVLRSCCHTILRHCFGLQALSPLRASGSISGLGALVSALRRKHYWSRGMRASDKSALPPELADEVRKICRIIAPKRWGPYVEKVLEAASHKLTADHVAEALKRQSDMKQALRFFLWAWKTKKHLLSSKAYRAILGSWGHLRQVRDFLNALAWLRRRDCKMTESLFTKLIKGYGLAGMADDALEIFQSMQRYGCTPNVISFSCILNILVRENKWEAARVTYQQMQESGCTPNAFTCRALIYWPCTAGEFVEAGQFLLKMIEDNHVPEIELYRLLIIGLLKTAKVEAAYRLSQTMKDKDYYTDVVVNNILICFLCEAGYLCEAMTILKQTVNNGCVADIICTILMESCSKAGKLTEFNQFQQIITETCQNPDARAYNSLLEGFFESCRFDQAYKVWEEMRKKGHMSDVVIHATLMKGLFSMGMAMDALKVGDLVTAEVLISDVSMHNLLIDAFSQGGYLDRAFDITAKMIERGCHPNLSTYKSLICGLCLHNRLEDAHVMIREMLANGCSPDVFVYNTLINGYCKADMLSEGLRLLDEMNRGGCRPDAYTLNILVSSLCKGGKVREAENLSVKMVSEGCPKDVVTFNTFIACFAKEGNWDAAYKYLNCMMEKGWLPDVVTYTSIISAMFSIGKPEVAQKLMNEMLESGIIPDNATYKTMIQGLCKANRLVEAYRLLGEAIDKKCIPTGDAYAMLSISLLRAGKVHAASELSEDLTEDWHIICSSLG